MTSVAFSKRVLTGSLVVRVLQPWAGIGGELGFIKACVLTGKCTEVREGKWNQGYIQRSDYNNGPWNLRWVRGETRARN